MARLRGRTDANQSSIVRDLRKAGASVMILSGVGEGCPDLLVGFRGSNYLFECKDGTQPPSKKRLTEDEKAFHLTWDGQVAVVETVEDCFDRMCLGASRPEPDK
jgi:hypothetical protein